MPKLIDSYLCGCGLKLDSLVETIREAKAKSFDKPAILDAGPKGHKHSIFFQDGKMVNILCPDMPRRAKKAAEAGAIMKPRTKKTPTEKRATTKR